MIVGPAWAGCSRGGSIVESAIDCTKLQREHPPPRDDRCDRLFVFVVLCCWLVDCLVVVILDSYGGFCNQVLRIFVLVCIGHNAISFRTRLSRLTR